MGEVTTVLDARVRASQSAERLDGLINDLHMAVEQYLSDCARLSVPKHNRTNVAARVRHAILSDFQVAKVLNIELPETCCAPLSEFNRVS